MHACVAVLLYASVAAFAAPPSAPTITTSCGQVSGATDMIPFDNLPAYRWSNIPYATPPIGNLRFRPPQAAQCPWSGILNGSNFANSCVQPSGQGVEDCLYLNVLSPTTTIPGQALLPVMVYFHGGNLISGSGPIGEMEVIAVKSDIIVVSVNYRLNILGFLATADLAAEDGWIANQGIQDAISSLQWTQANIKAFGGDPSRVTLMGQSSGGTLIFALYACPSAAGLFKGAISLSGSPNITMNAATKHAQDEPVVAAVNCTSGATPAERVACLRSLNASTLALAMPKPSWDTPGIFGWSNPPGIPAPEAGGFAYAGIVHVDGTLLTMSFQDALATALVPAALIISNMEAEGDGGPGMNTRNQTSVEWADTLFSSFASWPQEEWQQAYDTILSAYEAEALEDSALAYDSISADFGLSCAAQALGAAVAAANGTTQRPNSIPVYLLYNAWQRSTWLASGQGRWPYHGLDLQEMGYGWSGGSPPNATDLEASALLQSMIHDFCYYAGVMPGSWNWPPVMEGQPLQTLVFAQDGGWPGGGVRAVENWKQRQCAILTENFLGENYWWCD